MYRKSILILVSVLIAWACSESKKQMQELDTENDSIDYYEDTVAIENDTIEIAEDSVQTESSNTGSGGISEELIIGTFDS